MRVRVTVHSIQRPPPGAGVDAQRAASRTRPSPHRDFFVSAASIDAAREQARLLIERDGLELRSMSVSTDGSIRCIALR